MAMVRHLSPPSTLLFSETMRLTAYIFGKLHCLVVQIKPKVKFEMGVGGGDSANSG